MREYELWIDESGTFNPMDEADEDLNPSLIGGILIEKGKLQKRTIHQLVNKEAVGVAHANHFGRTETRDVVLPALEAIRKRGGHLFYIENKERIQTLSNRDLYLRMLVGGLVQLMMTLGQQSEEGFILNASIAKRSVHETENPHERGVLITDDIYISTLKEYIKDCWKSDKFDVELDCVLNISIMDARVEETLQLADYACNARLTRNSKRKFSLDMRSRLRAITESEYIYKVYVNLAENDIASAVATGDIAEALMVYFTTRDTGLDTDRTMNIIAERASTMSYRLNRLNLNSFSDQIVAYVRAETDFERSESILNRVLKDIPKFYHNIDIPFGPSLMKIYFCLSDMYLREGDVTHAGQTITEMGDTIRSLGHQVEDLKWLYYYNDRKALYEINCMDYKKAVKTIDKSINTVSNMMSAIDLDDNISEFFSDMDQVHSEYLGNALCMKIYAELFIQKKEPSIYENFLRKDISNAISQYNYEGGKERNLQYKSFAEAIAGRYQDSFRSLMSSACIIPTGDAESDCKSYLDKAMNEDRLSRTYYLMYYLYLMNEALNAEDDSISSVMYESLVRHLPIYNEFMKEDLGTNENRTVTDDSGHTVYKDIFGSRISDSQYDYHPLEIVYWKFGSYLRKSDRSPKGWDDYYKRALRVCRENPDYDLMKMIYIAIQFERIAGWPEGEPPKEVWISLKQELLELSRNTSLPKTMQEYVSDARSLVQKYDEGKHVTTDEMMEIVDRLGY